MHEKVHDTFRMEKRGDIIISRAMPIHSKELGVSGECDVVEFHLSQDGISLAGKEGLFHVIPIEYKRGSPKETDIDVLQLTAQALCLEEMLCCEISYGYLYYGETKRRKKIIFDKEMRQKTKDMFMEMHQYYQKAYTPKAKHTKSCNACSLKNICLPVLEKKQKVSLYIEKSLLGEDTN